MTTKATTHLTLIADYGTGDPAFQEVIQRLRLHLPSAHIETLSVPAFNTVATGFWIAQLGLNPGTEGRIIYHNCAPRKDNLKARVDNEGEGLTVAELPNRVKVIGVWAGHTLSFIKEHALSIWTVNVPKNGSQFRSRDIFPQALGQLLQGDNSLFGEEISPKDISSIPSNSIAWIDGYGNIKTTIDAHTWNLTPGTRISVRLGTETHEAIFADGSFTVPEGTLAFAPGSSGWSRDRAPHSTQWMELFLRGGNAWELFKRPNFQEPLTIETIREYEYRQRWTDRLAS